MASLDLLRRRVMPHRDAAGHPPGRLRPTFHHVEIWKDIPGCAGYQASTLGRVRSVDREVVVAGRPRRYGGKLLKPAPCSSGHMSVVLGRKTGSKGVHTLVAAAFLGPRPAGTEILHLDHNPSNNALSNLKYGTRGENLCMDYNNGSRTHLKLRHRAVMAYDGDGEPTFFASAERAGACYSHSRHAHRYVLRACRTGERAYGLKWRLA